MTDLQLPTSEKRNRRPSVRYEDFCDPNIDFIMPKKYNKIQASKGPRGKNSTNSETLEIERDSVGKKGLKGKNTSNFETLESERNLERDAFGRFVGKGPRGKNIASNIKIGESETLEIERNFVGKKGPRGRKNMNQGENLETSNMNQFGTLEIEVRDEKREFFGQKGPRGNNNTNISENLDIERGFVGKKGPRGKSLDKLAVGEDIGFLGQNESEGMNSENVAVGEERDVLGQKGLMGWNNASLVEMLEIEEIDGERDILGQNNMIVSEETEGGDFEGGLVGQKGPTGWNGMNFSQTQEVEEGDFDIGLVVKECGKGPRGKSSKSLGEGEERSVLGQKEPSGVNSINICEGEGRDVFGQKGPRGWNDTNVCETQEGGLVVKKCGKGPRGKILKKLAEGEDRDVLGQKGLMGENSPEGEERHFVGQKGLKGMNSKNLAVGEEKKGETHFLGQKGLKGKNSKNLADGEDIDKGRDFVGIIGPRGKNSRNLVEGEKRVVFAQKGPRGVHSEGEEMDGERDLVGEKWTSGWNDTNLFEIRENNEKDTEGGKQVTYFGKGPRGRKSTKVSEEEERDLIGGWGVTKSKNQRVRSNREFTKVGDDMDIEGGDEAPHHSPVQSLGNGFSREFEAEDIGISKDFEMEPSDSDEKNWNGGGGSNMIRDWLGQLGLGRYALVFEIHEVDEEVLPMLTLEDLKDMGINAVGSRRKIYSAIQKLNEGSS